MKQKLMAMILAAGAMLGARAATEIVDGIEWNYRTLEDGTFEICRGDTAPTIPYTTAGFVTVPSSFDDEAPVTRIGKWALYRCINLIGVCVSPNVRIIDEHAFNECFSLQEVILPPSVKYINDGAFKDCTNLTSVTLPESLVSIGGYAFDGCKSLGSIVIPESVRGAIGIAAFGDCSGLTNVIIRANVDEISSSAFLRCYKLETVELLMKNRLEEIGHHAFKDCWHLTNIKLPGSLKEIGGRAFEDCSNLQSINLPEGLKTIGEFAFGSCHRLQGSITIPGSLEDTGRGAFEYCYALEGVEIREGVKRIGNGSFCVCTNLADVTIPTTVTSIGTTAFRSCKKLKRIAIPPSVKEIGEKAFENSALDTVEVAPGDTDRVRALLAASGYDTSMVTFVESGDLSLLIGDTTFGDGAMLYGTLNGNYKISIADGATVTLLYANIVGVNDEAYPWAGITCEGDATIILGGDNVVQGFHEDYPGIHVPANKTLTIRGSGSLVASSNGLGAGIGAGYEIECGNIVINGGTITATGGYEAAGIGGAWMADNGKVTIGAGIVKVVATAGDNDAEPIGRGCAGESGIVHVDDSLEDTTSGLTRTIKKSATPVAYCMVTFNANGGDGGTVRSVKKGAAVGALPEATREGWTLDGWFTAADGGSQISASTVINGTITYFAHWTENPSPPDPETPTASFEETDMTANEGGFIVVVVSGGNPAAASSAKVYLTYHTAAAADLDLAKGKVDGETPKGGFKFPLSLTWEAGDTTTRVIEIPVKTDKTVEDDETLSLQLAETVGLALGENRLCTVKIHDLAYDVLEAKIAGNTASKSEQTTWNKLQSAKAPYIRGLADNADGGKVTGSGLCAEGKKVTLKATANKNFTFLGWKVAAKDAPYLPTGDYVATTASLVIDRTTKPAANTKTSTTLTGVTEDTTYYAVFESYPEVFLAVSATDASGATPTGKGAGKYVAGTVTGMGKYAPGKKVTVKATAAKSATTTYVHSGWYNGETLLSRAASYSFEMPSADVALTAKFITAAEDAAGVSATIAESWGFSSLVPKHTTSVPVGVYLEWPLAVKALSSTTVKVSGLPAGLKFTAKDIMKKGSKTEVEVPANTIYGVPTTAQNATVKIAITTSGKTKVEYTLALAVTPMAAWAVGTFDGGGDDGQLTLTVAATGKISGKYIGVDGKTWTLSAANFYELDELTPLYSAELLAKSGKETATLALEIGVNGKMDGYGVAEIRDEKDVVLGNLYQTNWKADAWKGIAGKIAKAKPYEYQAKDEAGNIGTITLKFSASGKVTAKGVFGSNAASCSTVIAPLSNPTDYGAFGACIYVCFPPKGEFAGYCGSISLQWDGTAFESK